MQGVDRSKHFWEKVQVVQVINARDNGLERRSLERVSGRGGASIDSEFLIDTAVALNCNSNCACCKLSSKKYLLKAVCTFR